MFADRREAGRLLAERLTVIGPKKPVVVALPRGGVPVGFEVARALAAPLDLLVVRKLGAPGNPELGVGAIAEGGSAVLDSPMAGRVGMDQQALDATVEREMRELNRRVAHYRGGRPPIEVRDATAIVVDDGLATGLTALAAVRALRAREAGRSSSPFRSVPASRRDACGGGRRGRLSHDPRAVAGGRLLVSRLCAGPRRGCAGAARAGRRARLRPRGL